ncbi:MAG: hypothetical protein KC897_08220 [Candidatus Omnitrophica bacterium]|nr:hypothetical protein [Candidatus Omnitrophota bacterium]MCB9721756.1 hypothetical protein [Candidatus Omnitrophota bacterium]
MQILLKISRIILITALMACLPAGFVPAEEKAAVADDLAGLEEQLRVRPLDPRLHREMVNLYMPLTGFRDDAAALATFRAQAEQRPRDIQNLLHLAQAQFRMQNYQELIVTAQRILEINPRVGMAYVYLADAYYDLGDYQQVIHHFEVLAKLQRRPPDQPKYSQRLGRAFYYTGRYEDCIRVFSQVLPLAQIPRDRQFDIRTDISAVGMFYAGLAAYRLERYAQAKEAFMRAQELFAAAPNDYRDLEKNILARYLEKLQWVTALDY